MIAEAEEIEINAPLYTLDTGVITLSLHLRKAGDGVRTRDLELGKLTLYQLSYARKIRHQYICRGGGIQENRCYIVMLT